MGVRAFLYRQTTELAVTNKRVIAKVGIISRATIEQRLEMVDSVQVKQGIIGRLLGAGSVGIRGAGARWIFSQEERSRYAGVSAPNIGKT